MPAHIAPDFTSPPSPQYIYRHSQPVESINVVTILYIDTDLSLYLYTHVYTSALATHNNLILYNNNCVFITSLFITSSFIKNVGDRNETTT